MRVLFLSYYFPPMGGVGVQRALKFVKYMPQYEVYPTVISAEDPNYVTDKGLLEQLPPQADVIRLRHTTLLNRLLVKMKSRSSSETPSAGHSSEKGQVITRRRIIGRDQILRYYSSLQFPDDKSAWGEQAYRAAIRAHAASPFDIIVSTSPPVTSHFVASRLKKKLGIPWVADFRDLWTENESYNLPMWRKWFDNRSEIRLLKNADGVVTVTKGFAESLRRVLPADTPLEVIYNGYDEQDFAHVTPMDKGTDRFLLLYAGTLYGKRSPLPLLIGLESLLEKEPWLVDKLCVRFVGNIGSRFEPAMNEFQLRHPGVIERMQFVAHDQIPAMLSSADALLLILGGNSTEAVLPAKIFEYLRANRPILFIGPEKCESSRLIKESGHGVTCDERYPEQVADAVKRVMDGKIGSETACPIERFERRHLTGLLVQFLMELRHGTKRTRADSLSI